MKLNTMHLRVLDNLFQDREKMIKDHIGSLQVSHVKEDSIYEATVNDIKKRTLLTPATIGEPIIKDNRKETRQVGPNFHMLLGGQRTVEIVTVNFPTTGSIEIFQFRSNGGALPVKDVYVPHIDGIYLDIEVNTLDKAAVIAEAAKEIETTRTLIAQNNPYVEQWSLRLSSMIDSLAAAKRKELSALYS